jgi:hypothetical protein
LKLPSQKGQHGNFSDRERHPAAGTYYVKISYYNALEAPAGVGKAVEDAVGWSEMAAEPAPDAPFSSCRLDNKYRLDDIKVE